MRQVAVEDSFGESGKPVQLMEKYGLNAKAIEAQVEDVMRAAPQRRCNRLYCIAFSTIC